MTDFSQTQVVVGSGALPFHASVLSYLAVRAPAPTEPKEYIPLGDFGRFVSEVLAGPAPHEIPISMTKRSREVPDSRLYVYAKNRDELRDVFERESLKIADDLRSLSPLSVDALSSYTVVVRGRTATGELSADILESVQRGDQEGVSRSLALIRKVLEGYRCPKMYDRSTGQTDFTVDLFHMRFNEGPQAIPLFEPKTSNA
jgi:hypothetical protein